MYPIVFNVKTRESYEVQRMEPNEEPECKVSGGLLLALYVGKWFGVAPLSFSRRGGEYCARFCRRTYIAGCFFVILTCSLSICGLIHEVTGDDSEIVRVKGGMTTVVWVTELMVIIIITSIGAFGAQGRIRQVVQLLIEKEKLDKQLSSLVTNKSPESSMLVPVAVSLTFVLALLLVDYYYIADVFEHYFSIQRFYYTFFYIKYMALVFLMTQFALLVLEARAPLKVFNVALQQQLNQLEDFIGFKGEFQIKDVSKYNKIIDSLCYLNKLPEISSDRLQSISVKCRQLFHLHGRAMELPQAVNTTYGVIVIMLLMIQLLHLVETPYYVITDTCTTANCAFNVCLQLVWMLYHLASLSAIVEPCHWTAVEVSRTSKLVSEMVRAAGSSAVSEELMLFTSALSVLMFRYSPMGMCKLTRPLMVSIMGAVTTYLVILVQFQTINRNMTP